MADQGPPIPDNRMWMPELFIPGRKPTQAVRIDWTNPLTKGLQICVLGGANSELANGFPLLRRNSVARVGSSEGLVDDFEASTAIIELVGSEDLRPGLTEDVSLYTFVNIDSTNKGGTLINKRDGVNQEFQFYTGTSGNIYCYMQNSTVCLDGVGGDIAGGWVGLGLTRNGTSAPRYLVDGEFVITGSAIARTSATDNNSPWSLGARWATYPTTGFQSDMLQAVTFVWFRELSDFEMKSIHNNRYQFLIPDM